MPDKTTAAARQPTNQPVLRGDEPELFRRHHVRLLRLVARDTGAPPAPAEDACAFAWLQLLRHQPERGRIVGWLRVVARHKALRLLRQQWRTHPLEVPTKRTGTSRPASP
jgi:DNA-directed RNA polymerase specialized sigma24 family protein